ncbi:MAG: VPLPA-CTERM sorting domain-containing protein, partial [Gammaproteobacteria bacterium]|nr:VPLPA-CTERM sorting domain-containing protein [Gammaproteobacteria bacterium]NNL99981.1 VPLPA-CTERM sorting domain-containing protein [Gammaproteobacteria bacterium]
LGTITGVSARVEPATSEVGDSQLILRPDDFAGSRLEHASLIGGINMITAAMIDDLDQVTNALFDPDALIDNTSAYIGDATTSKKGETEGPVAFQIVPADGFALTMGIGTEVQTKEGSGKKGKGKGKDPKTSNNYGWLRYTSLDSQIILHDLGIQITQNVPIEANAVPVPASLPLLASGAAGLAIFRRRRAIKGDGQDEK